MAFELCREMHWSWPELEATPMLVRQVFWEFIMRSRRAQNEAARRAARASEADPGAVRVRR